MTEHNINEAAPLAAAPLLAKGAKAGQVLGQVGKVAKRAGGALGGASDSVEKSSGRVSEETEEQLNEFKGSVPTPKTGPAKPASVVRPTGGIKPGFKPPSPRGVGAGVASSVGLHLADKMSQTIGKPGQSRMSGLGIQGAPPVRTKPKPQAPPKTPGIKPQPSPTKPEPKTEPSPDSNPGKEKQRRGTGVGTRTGQGVNASKGKRNERGSGQKNRQKQDSKVGDAIKTAATTAVGAAGLAALKKMSGKKLTTGDDIGKTSGRQTVKPKQTEEEIEIVCDYLIDEGLASTGVGAENIYSHMSDEWKQHIIESSCSKKKKKS